MTAAEDPTSTAHEEEEEDMSKLVTTTSTNTGQQQGDTRPTALTTGQSTSEDNALSNGGLTKDEPAGQESELVVLWNGGAKVKALKQQFLSPLPHQEQQLQPLVIQSRQSELKDIQQAHGNVRSLIAQMSDTSERGNTASVSPPPSPLEEDLAAIRNSRLISSKISQIVGENEAENRHCRSYVAPEVRRKVMSPFLHQDKDDSGDGKGEPKIGSLSPQGKRKSEEKGEAIKIDSSLEDETRRHLSEEDMSSPVSKVSGPPSEVASPTSEESSPTAAVCIPHRADERENENPLGDIETHHSIHQQKKQCPPSPINIFRLTKSEMGALLSPDNIISSNGEGSSNNSLTRHLKEDLSSQSKKQDSRRQPAASEVNGDRHVYFQEDVVHNGTSEHSHLENHHHHHHRPPPVSRGEEGLEEEHLVPITLPYIPPDQRKSDKSPSQQPPKMQKKVSNPVSLDDVFLSFEATPPNTKSGSSPDRPDQRERARENGVLELLKSGEEFKPGSPDNLQRNSEYDHLPPLDKPHPPKKGKRRNYHRLRSSSDVSAHSMRPSSARQNQQQRQQQQQQQQQVTYP